MEISHWKIHRLVSFYLVWARLTVSRLGNCINRFADFEVIWVNGAWKFRRFWNPLNSLNFKDDFQFFRFLNYFHFWNTGKFVSNKGSVYLPNSEQNYYIKLMPYFPRFHLMMFPKYLIRWALLTSIVQAMFPNPLIWALNQSL